MFSMVSACLFTGWRAPLVPTTHDAIGQLQITWGLRPTTQPWAFPVHMGTSRYKDPLAWLESGRLAFY